MSKQKLASLICKRSPLDLNLATCSPKSLYLFHEIQQDSTHGQFCYMRMPLFLKWSTAEAVTIRLPSAKRINESFQFLTYVDLSPNHWPQKQVNTST